MKVILLNGPPSSGKDTAARAIARALATPNVFFLRMSSPIKEAFAALTNLSITPHGNIAGMTQAHKEQINPTLGCSPRQWQIDFSERFMKPLYGDTIFARIWLHRAAQLSHDTVVVVPDIGFDIELQALTEAATSPSYPFFTLPDIFLMRIHRRDYNFKGDSRSYIYTQGRREVREVDMLNEDQHVFEAAVVRQVRSFLSGEP